MINDARNPRRLRRCALLLVAALIPACANQAAPVRVSTVAADGQPYQPGVSAIYCYRTLGGADCFRDLQPGPPNRLINGWADDVPPTPIPAAADPTDTPPP